MIHDFRPLSPEKPVKEPKADWVKRLKAGICGSPGRNTWNAQGARDGPLLLLA